MPCDSSHCAPSGREIESSKVRELLREVKGQPFTHQRRHEYYGDITTLDRDTAELCAFCTEHAVFLTSYSLELQVWWRDHQAADQKKAKQRATEIRQRLARKQALSKLTPEEIEALGIKAGLV